MRYDAGPRSKKGVCHLQDLARTSATADVLPFGQIWFRSVILVRGTGVLTDRVTRKHQPFIPITMDLGDCFEAFLFIYFNMKKTMPSKA